MAVQLTPLGKIVVGTFKWVVVPVLVAFVGLKLIGPNIGGGAPSPTVQQKPKNTAPQSENSKKFQEVREAEALNADAKS
jgi:hypothetical protein